jgi:hypothetical protein
VVLERRLGPRLTPHRPGDCRGGPARPHGVSRAQYHHDRGGCHGPDVVDGDNPRFFRGGYGGEGCRTDGGVSHGLRPLRAIPNTLDAA